MRSKRSYTRFACACGQLTSNRTHFSWPFYYSVEPTSFEAPDGQLLSEEQKETAVTGVEACMWSECAATTLPFACARAG